jgi:outer membrane biosynthesis protein TonB
MKPTAGYAKPRRLPEPPRRARLNLQRRPKPDPEEDLEERQRGSFWKWVLLVALLHVLVILGVCLYYFFTPTPPPQPQFITLLPPGDVVHGTPGAQQAHKLGHNTPAAPHHASPPPPPAHAAPPQPQAVTPPPVAQPPSPTPIIKETAPAPVKPPKPVKLTKPKPTPAKPKVKIDLHEVERPDATDTPSKPAKHHAKKPVKKPDDSHDDADSSPDTTGLSKEQIAEKLGDKLDASGSHDAKKYGQDGSTNGHANEFQDYYNLIRDQITEAWNSPLVPADNDPIIGMRVEHDGTVSPESVHLIRSSGDPAYDDAALKTVRSLGRIPEPLPDGCPPDMSLDFKPNP